MRLVLGLILFFIGFWLGLATRQTTDMPTPPPAPLDNNDNAARARICRLAAEYCEEAQSPAPNVLEVAEYYETLTNAAQNEK